MSLSSKFHHVELRYYRGRMGWFVNLEVLNSFTSIIMGISLEIERKFLVLSEAFKLEATVRVAMRQGYLSTDPGRVVRVRLSENLDSVRREAFLTIKGQSIDKGLSRVEWE